MASISLSSARSTARADIQLNFNQSFGTQGFYGLANNRSANTKLVSQLYFSGELVSGFEFAMDDALLDLLDDLLVQPWAVNGFIHVYSQFTRENILYNGVMI